MYEIRYAQGARKSLKRRRRSGSFPGGIFEELLELFIRGKPLPHYFQDHSLQGEFMGYRECHLGFNLLVIYKRNEERKVITISEVGTHPELFGE
jgi:mRNA interferase YafQ